MNTFFLMSTLILSGGQVLLGLAAVGGAIYLGIFATKTYLQQQALKIDNNNIQSSNLVRKHEVVDIKKHESNIKLAGFASALAIVMVIFAWTQFTSDQVLAEFFPDTVAIEMDVPPTPAPEIELPPALPPPTTQSTTIIEDDIVEEPIKDDIVEEPVVSTTPSNYTGPTDKNAKSMPFSIEPEPQKEVIKEEIDVPFDIVDQMPRFPGCEDTNADNDVKKVCADSKLLKFMYANIVYPAAAREMGIEGLAVVSFVVKKDGTIGDLKILKDPGGGCGKEAARVIKMMNALTQKWTPGKQRGKEVSVRYNLPVKFALR